MSTHFTFNVNLTSGSRLRGALANLESSRISLFNELATMTAALDGDGSNDAHFANVVAEYGFANTTVARSAWLELNSAVSKINSDASVSGTDAALKQLFTRLR